MKTKKATPYLIICVLLSAALLLSVVFLISAKSDVKELEAEILALTEENQQLSLLNQALHTQLNDRVGVVDGEHFCELSVDDWSQENGALNVSIWAQASLPAGVQPNARIEMWRGSDVIANQPITLAAGEIDGIFEAVSTLSFQIPAIEPSEELELWLIVEAPGCNTLFTCGAGWYQEDGQLMIIAG